MDHLVEMLGQKLADAIVKARAKTGKANLTVEVYGGLYRVLDRAPGAEGDVVKADLASANDAISFLKGLK